MSRVTKLTHDRLIDLLDFDPATGFFVWKKTTSNRVKVGSRAGVFHPPSGGRYVAIDGEKFMAHLLAWFYANGVFSSKDVRPIDGNFDNCAIANLKEVDRSELQHARGMNRNNTSGFQGVSAAPHDKWQAKITWRANQISLGMNFETAEEASAVVQDAYRRLKVSVSSAEVFSILRLEKRQRAAWANLMRNGDAITWSNFEEFCADVTDAPEHRYAMAPIDATKPMSKDNYKWASEGHAKTGTPEGFLQYRRENQKANSDHIRGRRFQKEYGIDFAEYQRMLIEQNGVCAVCEKPETKMERGTIRHLSVDHNHTTGVVRGLLCANCNMAIGYMCDDVTVLQKAIGYLRKHSDVETVLPFEPTRSDRDWLHVATKGFKA
jgi:Recombination endonuclease VII